MSKKIGAVSRMVSSPVNTHRDLCCLSRLTATAESTGYNTPTETVWNSTGFRIVRGLRLQIWIDRRQMRGNIRQRLTLLAKIL
jgi:hypothetical protein